MHCGSVLQAPRRALGTVQHNPNWCNIVMHHMLDCFRGFISIVSILHSELCLLFMCSWLRLFQRVIWIALKRNASLFIVLLHLCVVWHQHRPKLHSRFALSEPWGAWMMTMSTSLFTTATACTLALAQCQRSTSRYCADKVALLNMKPCSAPNGQIYIKMIWCKRNPSCIAHSSKHKSMCPVSQSQPAGLHIEHNLLRLKC